MDAVVETFGRHRLLSFDRDPDTREPTIEIAHEALLREWGRFRAWIDDAREDLRQRARISSATNEWIHAERSFHYLLSGIRLAQAEELTRDDSIRLTDTEREYLDASLAHRDAEAAAERMRNARELTLERRARTRLRGLVALLAVALLLALSLTVITVERSRETERERESPRSPGSPEGASNLSVDPGSVSSSPSAAVNQSASIGVPVPAETVEALHWAMVRQASSIRYCDETTSAGGRTLGLRGVFVLPLRTPERRERRSDERSRRPNATNTSAPRRVRRSRTSSP
jgi:hypothetical protein